MMDSPVIPETCFAAVTVDEGPNFYLEVKQVPVPVPGPGQLLLKLQFTGICGSDIHYCEGSLGMLPSSFGVQCAGHEGAGVVVKLGTEVDPSQWKVGDRAGIKPIFDVCHNCEQCWSGTEQYCAGARFTGVTDAGSYQQYVLSPANYTARIPDEVPLEIAAPIFCSGATMHRALVDSQLKPGMWVVFPGGGGGVGAQGIQLAKAMGMRTIAIDGGDAKEKLCTSLGTEHFIDFRTTKDIAARVKEITMGGAHGVLVTAWQSYKDAISYLGDRPGGKIVCIGLPPQDKDVTIGDSPTHLAMKRITIQGTIVGTMQDVAAALDYARRGLLKPIHEVRGRGQWPESIQQLRRGEVSGRIVIDFEKD